MPILSLKGQIVVRVDDVDVEQTALEHPKIVEGFPEALIAMVAALMKDEVKFLSRYLRDFYHSLVYESAERIEEEWLVTFKIGPCERLRAVAIEETEEQE